MRIAHVVRQYLPSLGGLEEVVRNLAQQQLLQGLQPYVITLNRVFRNSEEILPAEEIMDGVKVIRVPYFGSERYPLAFSILQHLTGADIVHVHAIDFFYDYLALTRFIHRKTLVASTHGGFFHTGFASRLKKIYFHSITKLSSRAYKKVIGCSDNDGEIFSQIIHDDRLCVIENGVDTQKFYAAAATNKRPVLIYFGRWSSNKGLLEMLKVLQSLNNLAGQDAWRLIICGRSFDVTDKDLKAYALELGVNNCIEILSSPSNAVIKEKIAHSTYFICLSKHEGFGIAPIEAMSAGLFPLLSDIPPFKKLVQQTNIGITFKTHDVDQIALDIIKQHAAIPIAKEQVMLAVAAYSWNNVAGQYYNQYLGALERK